MNNHKQEIFLYGAGGHAKVVIDIIEKENKYKIVFIVDDGPQRKGDHLLGYPIVGGRKELLDIRHRPSKAIVAIGDNQARKKVVEFLEQQDIEFVNTIHPTAIIAKNVFIGPGSVVMAMVAINPCTRIGNHVIVNTAASVDHDCIIEDFVHLAPGTTICGTVTVGNGTLIGAGSTIIPNVTIGKKVLVGAGTTIYKDIANDIKVIGPRAVF